MEEKLLNIDSETTVIIGAGTVGLLLAHELKAKGHKILLIEAAADSIESYHSSEYKTIGHTHTGISIGRTKGFGGTSNLWGGQLTEFSPYDIEDKGVYGQPEWPITWNEIYSYYPRVYDQLGLNGNMVVENESLSKNSATGNLELIYTRWIKQPNFKFHFLNNLEQSHNVTILKNTVVSNLFFKENNCTEIEIIKEGLTKNLKTFKRVILTSGTIEISRLLLIAAQSDSCPFNKNKNIGKYFQDHLHIHVGRITNASKKFFERFSNCVRKGEKLQPKIRIIHRSSTAQYFGISGIFSFDSKVSHHLDNFKQFIKALLGRSTQKLGFKSMLQLFFKLIAATPQIILIVYNYLKNNRIYVPFKSTISLNLQTQQITNFDSQINIDKNQKDNYNRPKVILDWKIDGREFLKIKEFCLEVKSYFSENGYGDLQIEKWLENVEDMRKEDLLTHVSDTYHQAGGAIMSSSAENGVVDKNLKVHGTENLFVCGACVMPTSSYANTALTALALSLRLSDHLTEKLVNN